MTQSEPYWLKFTLQSDATFGRGDGVAGWVDAEVQHDTFGLPYLGGKTLKGLLGATCAEILSALEKSAVPNLEKWEKGARFLFGEPGSGSDVAAKMYVGNAMLPSDLRLKIAAEFPSMDDFYDWGELLASQQQIRTANLNSLTALRRQTAIDARSGAPKENSLRTMRVILKGTPFIAKLEFIAEPDEYAKQLLAATVKSFNRAGTGRNRGRGRLKAELFAQPFYQSKPPQVLEPDPVTQTLFARFKEEVQGASANL